MPEHACGTEELWRANERRLGDALTRNGFAWEINPGEGAFYGPKIEIYVPDALKRKWQVATIQLDYAVPERFDLTYTSSAGAEQRPVVIHRAILGSARALHRRADRAYRRGAADVARARAGARALAQRKGRGLRQRARAVLSSEGFRATADIRSEKLGFKRARRRVGRRFRT